jgi:hypothetical protein
VDCLGRQRGAVVVEYLLLLSLTTLLLLSNIDALKVNLVTLNQDLATKAKALAADLSI